MFKITALFCLYAVAFGSVFLHNSTSHNHAADNSEDLAIPLLYHLFTRENPSVSQPLILNNSGVIQSSNYRNNRRTIVLIHDSWGSAESNFNAVLVPTFLLAEDVNVIVVDWSSEAATANYRALIRSTIECGQIVARFINWLNQETQSTPSMYHIVGFGWGGQQAGIVGRNVDGNIAYITALDPTMVGWSAHPDVFASTDAVYTEVIHTNAGIYGFLADLGNVDFYPNGGIGMPGCNSNACDHERSYFYFAESISTGGFTGVQCLNYFTAIAGACTLMPGRLQMGGLNPKTTNFGVYHLETNAASPFSRD